MRTAILEQIFKITKTKSIYIKWAISLIPYMIKLYNFL